MGKDNRPRHFLVVGAGNLGSRHVQSLLLRNDADTVHVVDPSPESRKLTEVRANEAKRGSINNQLFLYNDLEIVPDALISTCVIATSSRNRLEALEAVCKRYRELNIILEKFLFHDLGHYPRAANILKESVSSAWVNCSRRTFAGYQKLKDVTKGPILFELDGINWGLACNTIHFLDLISFLTDESLKSIDTEELDSRTVPTKREGYVEVFGRIEAEFDLGSRAIIRSGTGELRLPSITITDSNGQKFAVSEADQTISQDGVKLFEIGIKPQSALTAGVVDDILRSQRCQLPDYDESAFQHQLFLSSLINHIVDSGDPDGVLENDQASLPIT